MTEQFKHPIGADIPRDRAKRLLAGRGRFVDDVVVPRTMHIAFVRSPAPHARFSLIDIASAQSMPGVIRVLTAAGS